MDHPFSLRVATRQDAAAIADIYRPYVLEDVASFEYTPPDAKEILQRMDELQPQYPWLVCETAGRVSGYIYAGRLFGRKGYDWVAQSGIYLAMNQRRCGQGRALYTALIALLRHQNYRALFAGVSVPNPASAHFHTSMGFVRQGGWPNAGYKFGRPLSVDWYSLDLLPPVQDPPPPTPFSQLAEETVRDILAAACR